MSMFIVLCSNVHICMHNIVVKSCYFWPCTTKIPVKYQGFGSRNKINSVYSSVSIVLLHVGMMLMCVLWEPLVVLRGERESEPAFCLFVSMILLGIAYWKPWSCWEEEEEKKRERGSWTPWFFFWYALTVSIVKAYSTLLCIFIVSVILLGVALFYLLRQLQVCTWTFCLFVSMMLLVMMLMCVLWKTFGCGER